MKKKMIIYFLLTSLDGSKLKEERLYKFSKRNLYEYVGGNFQKVSKKVAKQQIMLFITECSFATLIKADEPLEVKITGGCFNIRGGTFYNLRDSKQREEFERELTTVFE